MKSRLYLPKLDIPPATILQHLHVHFPQIPPSTWDSRIERGAITTENGTPVLADSAYRHGITIFYEKEVPFEPEAMESESVLYRDEEILVADKPHGMPVTPAGSEVERSLLVRLQRSTGLSDLAPVHRLDRETAGILLFAVNPATRRRYHELFAKGTIEREYFAISHLGDAGACRQWSVENRIEPGDPWYRQQIVAGATNSITEIELIEVRAHLKLFRLRPRTGKTHQIRVHMASLGFPILGDPLYPMIREKQVGEPPLQLLAHKLTFTDPISGQPRNFTSLRQLLISNRAL